MRHNFFDGINFDEITTTDVPFNCIARSRNSLNPLVPNSWKIYNQAKSTFIETPMRNNLLKVDEESESLNRVAELSETSKNEDCFYS